MRLILNVLWAVFGGGLVIFFEYVVGGLLLCLTVVGILFGLQCFKIAGLGLFTFGKDITTSARSGPLGGVVGLAFNLLWLVVAGIWIFLTHVVIGLGLAITVIGIPFAFQHLKLAVLALAPFGQTVRG